MTPEDSTRVRRFQRLEHEIRAAESSRIQISIRISELDRKEIALLNKREMKVLEDMLRFVFPLRNTKEREEATQAALLGLCKKIRGWHRMDGSQFLRMNPQQDPDFYRFKPYSELPFIYRFLRSRLSIVQDMKGCFVYEFERRGIQRQYRPRVSLASCERSSLHE